MHISVPKAADVEELAKIESGTVSNISIETPAVDKNTNETKAMVDQPDGLLVNTLIYTDESGDFVTYSRTHDPVYISAGPVEWSKGTHFEVSQILMANPYNDGEDSSRLLFRRLKAHTSGSRSNTRDPSVKSNKCIWEFIGSVDGTPKPYSPTVRYGVGVVATYNGNLYIRTSFNLTCGQTPYSKSNSRY